jgi:hypothetical protein
MITIFIEHMISKKAPTKNIEYALMQLDLKTVDLNFIVATCESFGLFTALIFFLSEGMLDFYAPISKLCKILRAKTELVGQHIIPFSIEYLFREMIWVLKFWLI